MSRHIRDARRHRIHRQWHRGIRPRNQSTLSKSNRCRLGSLKLSKANGSGNPASGCCTVAPDGRIKNPGETGDTLNRLPSSGTSCDLHAWTRLGTVAPTSPLYLRRRLSEEMQGTVALISEAKRVGWSPPVPPQVYRLFRPLGRDRRLLISECQLSPGLQ